MPARTQPPVKRLSGLSSPLLPPAAKRQCFGQAPATLQRTGGWERARDQAAGAVPVEAAGQLAGKDSSSLMSAGVEPKTPQRGLQQPQRRLLVPGSRWATAAAAALQQQVTSPSAAADPGSSTSGGAVAEAAVGAAAAGSEPHGWGVPRAAAAVVVKAELAESGEESEAAPSLRHGSNVTAGGSRTGSFCRCEELCAHYGFPGRVTCKRPQSQIRPRGFHVSRRRLGQMFGSERPPPPAPAARFVSSKCWDRLVRVFERPHGEASSQQAEGDTPSVPLQMRLRSRVSTTPPLATERRPLPTETAAGLGAGAATAVPPAAAPGPGERAAAASQQLAAPVQRTCVPLPGAGAAAAPAVAAGCAAEAAAPRGCLLPAAATMQAAFASDPTDEADEELATGTGDEVEDSSEESEPDADSCRGGDFRECKCQALCQHYGRSGAFACIFPSVRRRESNGQWRGFCVSPQRLQQMFGSQPPPPPSGSFFVSDVCFKQMRRAFESPRSKAPLPSRLQPLAAPAAFGPLQPVQPQASDGPALTVLHVTAHVAMAAPLPTAAAEVARVPTVVNGTASGSGVGPRTASVSGAGGGGAGAPASSGLTAPAVAVYRSQWRKAGMSLLGPGDPVILTVNTASREYAEYILPRHRSSASLGARIPADGRRASACCAFALARVWRVLQRAEAGARERSCVAATGSAGPSAGSQTLSRVGAAAATTAAGINEEDVLWVELDPAGWVWLDNTPWEQLREDMGMYQRCQSSRRVVQTPAMQHYADAVEGLLRRHGAAVAAAAATSGGDGQQQQPQRLPTLPPFPGGGFLQAQQGDEPRLGSLPNANAAVVGRGFGLAATKAPAAAAAAFGVSPGAGHRSDSANPPSAGGAQQERKSDGEGREEAAGDGSGSDGGSQQALPVAAGLSAVALGSQAAAATLVPPPLADLHTCALPEDTPGDTVDWVDALAGARCATGEQSHGTAVPAVAGAQQQDAPLQPPPTATDGTLTAAEQTSSPAGRGDGRPAALPLGPSAAVAKQTASAVANAGSPPGVPATPHAARRCVRGSRGLHLNASPLQSDTAAGLRAAAASPAMTAVAAESPAAAAVEAVQAARQQPCAYAAPLRAYATAAAGSAAAPAADAIATAGMPADVRAVEADSEEDSEEDEEGEAQQHEEQAQNSDDPEYSVDSSTGGEGESDGDVASTDEPDRADGHGCDCQAVYHSYGHAGEQLTCTQPWVHRREDGTLRGFHVSRQRLQHMFGCAGCAPPLGSNRFFISNVCFQRMCRTFEKPNGTVMRQASAPGAGAGAGAPASRPSSRSSSRLQEVQLPQAAAGSTDLGVTVLHVTNHMDMAVPPASTTTAAGQRGRVAAAAAAGVDTSAGNGRDGRGERDGGAAPAASQQHVAAPAVAVRALQWHKWGLCKLAAGEAAILTVNTSSAEYKKCIQLHHRPSTTGLGRCKDDGGHRSAIRAFALARVRRVLQSSVEAGSSSKESPDVVAASDMVWVELDPASWVWLDNVPYTQLQLDMGLHMQCQSSRRVVKTPAMQHYADAVQGLLRGQGAAVAAAAATSGGGVGRQPQQLLQTLLPFPDGGYLRSCEVGVTTSSLRAANAGLNNELATAPAAGGGSDIIGLTSPVYTTAAAPLRAPAGGAIVRAGAHSHVTGANEAAGRGASQSNGGFGSSAGAGSSGQLTAAGYFVGSLPAMRTHNTAAAAASLLPLLIAGAAGVRSVQPCQLDGSAPVVSAAQQAGLAVVAAAGAAAARPLTGLGTAARDEPHVSVLTAPPPAQQSAPLLQPQTAVQQSPQQYPQTQYPQPLAPAVEPQQHKPQKGRVSAQQQPPPQQEPQSRHQRGCEESAEELMRDLDRRVSWTAASNHALLQAAAAARRQAEEAAQRLAAAEAQHQRDLQAVREQAAAEVAASAGQRAAAVAAQAAAEREREEAMRQRDAALAQLERERAEMQRQLHAAVMAAAVATHEQVARVDQERAAAQALNNKLRLALAKAQQALPPPPPTWQGQPPMPVPPPPQQQQQPWL
ncbi:hypothetical protein HYH02_014980 [Chlamydomonas schloesseri]|uniref:Uncharacterized protein n=1 Tax=Chlamydomonas schloesseri TaxID=2026947 RepID=A0A835VUE0_9CHLO|nr:hypothetical protein HYH02_014980 [Chlamydomonas schloesseri]|eukprot:KAG2425606.1 hypothetical protein HYH02_014980 [Chlamydomonas schloesseri]